MKVTKQQQLEWLANKWLVWANPFGGYVKMSRSEVGVFYAGMTPEGAHQITYQEWSQERDKMQKQETPDSSWHELGELPPVGIECWSTLDNKPVFIVAKHCAIDAVIYSSALGGGELFYGYSGGFRPLRTEREKTIDEMVHEFIVHYGDPKGGERYLGIAKKLYDAGYRKQ